MIFSKKKGKVIKGKLKKSSIQYIDNYEFNYKSDIRICTFNVWRDNPIDTINKNSLKPVPIKKINNYQKWKNREAAICGFFRSVAPHVDIFGLQECTPFIKKIILKVLHQIDKSFKAIDNNPDNQEQILFRSSRLILLDDSASSVVLPGSEHTDQNKFTSAVFELREKPDKKFSVGNTHLSWQGNWLYENGPNNIRYNQMRFICEELSRGVHASNEDLIILGDFNDVYIPLRVAAHELQLFPTFTSLKQLAPHTCPTPNTSGDGAWDIDNFASKTYDWILTRGVRVISTCRVDYNLNGVYPSDHYPIWANFSFI